MNEEDDNIFSVQPNIYSNTNSISNIPQKITAALISRPEENLDMAECRSQMDSVRNIGTQNDGIAEAPIKLQDVFFVPAPQNDDFLRPVKKERPSTQYIHFQGWADAHYSAGRDEISDSTVLTYGTIGLSHHYAVPFDSEIMQGFVKKYIEGVYRYGETVVLDQRIIARGNVEPIRLFFDYDFKDSNPISDKYIYDVCSIASQTVRLFFPQFSADVENNPKPKESERHGLDDKTLLWYSSSSMEDSGFARLRSMISVGPTLPSTLDHKHKCQMYKRGAHQNWTESLLLTRPQIKAIRKLIIKFCEFYLGDRDPANPDKRQNKWSDVIDLTMFNVRDDNSYNGGLRMIGSAKVENPCGACNGSGKVSSDEMTRFHEAQTEWREKNAAYKDLEKRYKNGPKRDNAPIPPGAAPIKPKQCGRCNNTKKALVVTRYVPWMVIDGNGVPEPEMSWLMKNPNYFMWACSIHSLSTIATPQYVESKLVPADVDEKKTRQIPKNRSFARTDISNPHVKEDIPIESVECVRLMGLIRTITPNWLTLMPERFFRKAKDTYILSVHGPGDRWCRNANKNHMDITGKLQNRIFFTLSVRGLRQKCHSDNGGLCGAKALNVPFVISGSRIPREIMTQLFEDMMSDPAFSTYLDPVADSRPVPGTNDTLLGKSNLNRFMEDPSSARVHIDDEIVKNEDSLLWGHSQKTKPEMDRMMMWVREAKRVCLKANPVETRQAALKNLSTPHVTNNTTASNKRKPDDEEEDRDMFFIPIEPVKKKRTRQDPKETHDVNGNKLPAMSWTREVRTLS